MRLLLLVFFLPLSTFAQAPDPWAVVQSLPAGQDGPMLKVRLEDGKARGRLISADAEGLVLRTGSGGERRIDRSQVQTVKLRPRGNAPVWGTLAGLGLGLPNAGLADGVSGAGRVGAVALPAAGGFLIGSLIKNGKTRTIYQAP